MIQRPRLKGYLTVVPQDDAAFVVHGSEGEVWRLRLDPARHAGFRRLLPLLTGEHELAEIQDRVATADLPGDAVRRLVDGLETAGIIEDGTDGVLPPRDRARYRDQLLFFSRFSAGRDGAAFQRRLADASVDILQSGPLGLAVARHLARAGVGRLTLIDDDPARLDEHVAASRDAVDGVVEGRRLVRSAIDELVRGSSSGLLIAALESFDPQLLEAVNDAALAARRPWLLVQQRGAAEGLVGPLFVPGHTACYMCMEGRLRANTALVAEYDALREYLRLQCASGRPWGGLAPHGEILAGIAAAEVVKHITGFAPPRLAGRFCSVNWFTWSTELHDVLRVPRCPFCRPPRVETFPWAEFPQPEPEAEPVR
jgi:bacteriocin biosynthesis cyclodehydratase domain-containing protein